MLIRCLFFLVSVGVTSSLAIASPLLVGSYDEVRMKSVSPLTLPRIMVYDQDGKLMDRTSWPAELANLKDKAGDAFCCVSDEPAPAGSKEPPPGCTQLVYGEAVRAHFDGLKNSEGKAITYDSLPTHSYLIVEYFADWCSPCHAARQELELVLAGQDSKGYVGLTIDFSKLTEE